VEKAFMLFIALLRHVLQELPINPGSLIPRAPSLYPVVVIPEIMSQAAVVEVVGEGVVRNNAAAVVIPVETCWHAGSFGGEERVHGSREEKPICLLLARRAGDTNLETASAVGQWNPYGRQGEAAEG
jgi:hypothetical protein